MKGAEKSPRGKAEELLAEFPLMALMCMSMVWPFVSALEFGLSFTTVLLTVLVCLAFWTAALYNRATMLGLLALAAAGAAAFFLLVLSHTGGAAALRARMDNFLYWAGMYLKGYRTTNLRYAAWLVAMFSAVVCLEVCIFTFKQFDFVTVLLSGAACYAALVAIGHRINLPALFCYILAASLYAALNGYKRNAREMAAENLPKLPAFMASALPLAAVVLALTIFLSGAVKIDPGWMKDFRDRLLHKTNAVSQQIADASGKTVISSDELGGNLYLNGDVVMEVKSPVAGVYLRAESKSSYTGNSWFQPGTDQTGFNGAEPEDTVTTEALIAGDPDKYGKLFPSEDIAIQYKEFSTGIVYAPLKMSGLDIGKPVTLVSDDEIMLTGNCDENLSYSLQYYQPAYGSDALAELARSMGGGSGNAISGSAILPEYTQLPSTLPQRVRDLAGEITKGASNEYDKAAAVENYLKDNYAYTLTPGSCDPDRDFADQFLFEGRKGYCTYFATAMAVLLRCEGVPTRYVEGYILPGAAGSQGVYEVTKKQGHAWVEVYFNGLGWLTFDPTPSFSGDSAHAAASSTPQPRPTPSPAPTASAAETPVSASGKKVLAPGFEALLIALAILAAAILFAAYFPRRAKAALKRTQDREAAILLFAQQLAILEAQGIALSNGEDLRAFAREIDGALCLGKPGFARAAEIFQQARFSGHETTPEQRQSMAAFRKELLRASRKKLGIFRYLYFKYIWGI